jgi:hypothetical protein
MGAYFAYSNLRARKNIAPEMRKGSLRCLFLIAYQVSGRGRLRIRLLAVLLAEFFDTSGGVHDFLLAGIEGMAGRADFHVQGFAQSGTRGKGIAATAGHCDVGVFGMNFRLHFDSFLMEAGFALPKGADYPQVFGDWQPRRPVACDA